MKIYTGDRKYYASGVEISALEKSRILNGETEKSIRGTPMGQPITSLTDAIKTEDGALDKTDPILTELLKVLDLPIEKTFIVQWDGTPSKDPLNCQVAFVYGYY